MADAPQTPVAVLGAGSWGTALAILCARHNLPTTLWSFEPEVAGEINRTHFSQTYLKDVPIPGSIRATANLPDALQNAQMVLLVIPSQFLRDFLNKSGKLLPLGVPLINAAKGIENKSLKTMSELMQEMLPTTYAAHFAFLSGPSFAREVALGVPTAVTLATDNQALGAQVQALLSGPTFRVYTTADVVGVELGGALKNVIAIACGVSDGLGLGHNARAALITRGLAEISRLAIHRGGNPLTLSGLAGMGDLILTCTGDLSRNRQVGLELGRGKKLKQILGEMKMVAEGVATARAAHDLAKKSGIDMPITERVYQVLYEDKPPREGLKELMARELRTEEI